ncbi:hypothetical protein [Mycolicibacterium rhodesiae]|uniref:Phage gp6-like head-tail connector protein n=1 Tax=Mycolicibacterium rhodesiae TaxID=36814 RepID=A0A1X0J5G1_MYCRH|nr:hypothetical protein [Mycolicibacterium rhodesiae]MCV7348267.1 hypothetical protein [Mycolicibacterium rhodesiae]ORB57392.1 hypothetical protein BST42_03180 [Mycolicibacterium rhodesiae]
MTYPDPADLAQWLGVDAENPNVVWCIESAADAVEKACGRTFRAVTDPEQRTYLTRHFHGRTFVDVDDVMTADGLLVEVDGVEVTSFTLLPPNAAQRGKPWTQVELPMGTHGWVAVTGRWGWTETEIPSAIRIATVITAARLYDRRQNVAGSLSEQRIDDVESTWRVSALDTDVEILVAPYRRIWAAI